MNEISSKFTEIESCDPIWTPNEVRQLLYFFVGEPTDGVTPYKVLVDKGLFQIEDAETDTVYPTYALSEKGKAFCNFLLSTPIPEIESRWVLPARK